MVRNVILFIAMSLDGYIADKNGGVNWLDGQNPEEGTSDAYSSLLEHIDTVIMGWNTYHQIVTELSPETWVYDSLTSYVITHRSLPSTDKIRFTAQAPCSLVHKLKQEPGKDIWICGGAKIIQPLMKAGLIDEYHLSIIPTLLGSGIRLFDGNPAEIKLKLLHTQTANGIMDLVYTRR